MNGLEDSRVGGKARWSLPELSGASRSLVELGGDRWNSSKIVSTRRSYKELGRYLRSSTELQNSLKISRSRHSSA